MEQISELKNKNQYIKPVKAGTIVIAISLTILVILFSTYLLIMGQKVTGYYDQSPEDIAQGVLPTVIESYQPYPGAILPLMSSVLLLFGLIKREKYFFLAWIGLAFLLASSALLMFSSGGIFLPIAGLLLICLLLITIMQRKENLKKE